ncbi:MAG: sulfurtransferase [Pseudomonadota bacterium]
MPERFLNLSAYRFVALDRLPERRESLHRSALACGLRGTVLLAGEGINLFVAGPGAGLREWLASVRADPLLAALEAKESWSEQLPFRHLRVKIKREIIRMNQPQLRPSSDPRGRAPAIDATTLRRWLDAGRDDAGREVLLLDTRNGFEVDVGAFDGAVDWRLDKFSDFPAALAARRSELEGRTVVSYCTGGIRCEKAALALREAGLDAVYQLDGGVLRYFEQMPDAPHWRGRCFVFDGRETLGPDLAPEGG